MIKVGGVDYTKNTLVPIKWQEVADDSLSSGIVTLKNISRAEAFEPLTEIEIDGEIWLISYDEVEKTIVGKNPKYTHTISFIEETKLAEKYIVDTCTFTNSIFTGIVEGEAGVEYYPIINGSGVLGAHVAINSKPNAMYLQNKDKRLYALSINKVFTPRKGCSIDSGSVGIYRNNIPIDGKSGLDTEVSVPLLKGKYKIVYYLNTHSAQTYFNGTISFNVTVIEEQEKLTITDCVNRVLEIAETLRENDTPKFTFNSEQATKYSSVYAPEFTITKKTLREAMQIIGSYIHAKPRLKGNEWSFVEYSVGDVAKLPKRDVSEGEKWDLESFCNELDTYVDNLVNYEENGSIIEPYNKGWKTPRVEVGQVRMDETNFKFIVSKPIEKIVKFEIGFLHDREMEVGDITKYVYEQTEYMALSSYVDSFPNAKAYALSYKRGEKEITGMQFEKENSFYNIFTQKAIVNIINDKLGTGYTDITIGNLTQLQFRITYIPVNSLRAKQVKSKLADLDNKVAMVYNISDNKVDSNYYGENLKGTIARLGNVEKTYTYITKDKNLIPKAGQKYSDSFWISLVVVEKYKDIYKFTIGLSKDFNKLNEYIGVDSNIRMYEVAVEQIYDRWITYEDMLIVGNFEDEEELRQYDISVIERKFFDNIIENFVDMGEGNWKGYRLNYFSAITYDDNGSKLGNFILPISKFSIGNTAMFTAEFEDNFSAGATIVGREIASIGYQQDAQYCDINGKVETMEIYGQIDKGISFDYETAVTTGDEFPYTTSYGGNIMLKIGEENRLKVRKDNRERIHINYMIHCVTNEENVIIGSALAKMLVGKQNTYETRDSVGLYVLNRKVNKFERVINDALGERIAYNLNVYNVNGIQALYFTGAFANTNGESFVLINEKTKELVFAKNIGINRNDEIDIPPMNFRRYRKVEN